MIRCSTLLAVSAALTLRAADAPVDFTHEIEPLLAKHCVKCHGPEKQKGGLRLDQKAAAFKGGDSEERGIVPGHAGESGLFQAVLSKDEDKRMPPRKGGGEPLTARQIALLKQWIDAGAEWPESREPKAALVRSEMKVTDADRNHWSFLPLATVVPPTVADKEWARTPVDRFIRHAHEAKGISWSVQADARTLVRRIYFDLTGLPRPEEMTRWFRAWESPATPSPRSWMNCSPARTTANAGRGTGSTSRAPPTATGWRATTTGPLRIASATLSSAR